MVDSLWFRKFSTLLCIEMSLPCNLDIFIGKCVVQEEKVSLIKLKQSESWWLPIYVNIVSFRR